MLDETHNPEQLTSAEHLRQVAEQIRALAERVRGSADRMTAVHEHSVRTVERRSK